jgi:hypothetical protein
MKRSEREDRLISTVNLCDLPGELLCLIFTACRYGIFALNCVSKSVRNVILRERVFEKMRFLRPYFHLPHVPPRQELSEGRICVISPRTLCLTQWYHLSTLNRVSSCLTALSMGRFDWPTIDPQYSSILCKLTLLRHLEITNCRFHSPDALASQLQSLTQLERLQLVFYGMDDWPSASCFTALTNLRSLCAYRCPNLTQEILNKLTRLEVLELCGDQTGIDLCAHTNLRTLCLWSKSSASQNEVYEEEEEEAEDNAPETVHVIPSLLPPGCTVLFEEVTLPSSAWPRQVADDYYWPSESSSSEDSDRSAYDESEEQMLDSLDDSETVGV